MSCSLTAEAHLGLAASADIFAATMIIRHDACHSSPPGTEKAQRFCFTVLLALLHAHLQWRNLRGPLM